MENKKLVMLPLDERPCNFEFPKELFKLEDIELVLPEKLGDKKTAADTDEIISFLERECTDASAAVISMDMLLYGGLIPSRLHHLTEVQVSKRLDTIKKLKMQNPKLKIYAFQCIMRCPSYSSSDEEPDYYEDCGEQIHKLGRLLHMEKLDIQPENEGETKESLSGKIKEEWLLDYTQRRSFNLEFNIQTAKLVQEGIIDFLVIPQDDSAKYGYTAMDQITVRNALKEYGLSGKVYIYPGADEVGLTLLSRAVNELDGKMPSVCVKYAAAKAPFMIPQYEDRPLDETLKYQLLAAGCVRVESAAQADFVLALSAPGGEFLSASQQPAGNPAYDTERSLPELIAAIKYYSSQNKPVSLCDNAYGNGGDLELLDMLNNEKLLYSLAGYAGWNTSANSLGTAIAQAVVYLRRGNTKEHRDFLALRYIEDFGYCAVVRGAVTQKELPGLQLNYFDAGAQRGEVSSLVEKYLNEFRRDSLSSIADKIEICDVRMPWRRMFEVGLKVRSCGDNE